MSFKSKLCRIPQFFTDADFRTNVIRRRVLYPLLSKGAAKFFPNIKYFTVHDGHSWFTASMHDRGTAWSLLVSGHLDHDFFETSLALSAKEGLLEKNNKNIFLDVGANIGTHSVYALRSGYFNKVIAIEPNPENYKLLKQNIRANDLDASCTLHHAAVGAKRGNATLELSGDHSGDHRVRLSESGGKGGLDKKDEANRNTIQVPILSLDDLMAKEKIPKGAKIFISIDVQGFEPQILEGAKNLMLQGAIFCIEFWPYGLRYNKAEGHLNSQLAENFEAMYDVRDGLEGKKIPSDKIVGHYERYTGMGFTDLLLIPKPPPKKSAKKTVKKPPKKTVVQKSVKKKKAA